MKKLATFGWFGGKFSHLTFILPNLETECKHFVDVFGGSGAVIINRDPAPILTYNDIDGELVNFFKVLRDQGEKFIELASLTLRSRQEYGDACGDLSELSELERARLFFLRAKQSFGGLGMRATKGSWSRSLHAVRRSMSKSVSDWLSGIEHLPEIVQRLKTMQIEHLPALKIIQKYDSPDTLFYLDPPYTHAERPGGKNVYRNEMTDEDHVELGLVLHEIKGKAVISGYESPLYQELYGDWECVTAPPKAMPASTTRRIQTEVIWRNFTPAKKAGDAHKLFKI